jgi:Ca2+-binding RTX toxin-like protein
MAAIVGTDGINTLLATRSSDQFDGKGGLDYVSYVNARTGLRASLIQPGLNTRWAAGDTYVSIENLIGSQFDDRLEGNDLPNQLIGGKGADKLYGGLGFDRAAYWTSDEAVTASLHDPSINTGDAEGDTYDSIENLMGTRFDDTLIGSNDSNSLIGREGADHFFGLGGIDHAQYYHLDAVGGVTANLANPGRNTGEAAGDTYDSIEGLVGTKFDDVLIGDDGMNWLQGADGADKLKGGSGDDFLVGGLGKDVLRGGRGADRFYFYFVGDSEVGEKRDVVYFSRGDKIDLYMIDANTGDGAVVDPGFNWIGDGSFTKRAGQLRFADGLLQGDVDGDGDADFEISIVIATPGTFGAADILL